MSALSQLKPILDGKSVKIRLMNPDECEQVWKADVEAFKNSPFGELTGMKKKTDEELKNWQSGGEKFRTLCREHPDQVIVAVTEDGVAGFASYEYFPEKRSGRVFNCAVLPDYRGRGIGPDLLRRLLKELQSLGAQAAEVQTSHVPAACRMYEKAGFKFIKREQRKTEDGREYFNSWYEINL